jgi:hypothetical protein
VTTGVSLGRAFPAPERVVAPVRTPRHDHDTTCDHDGTTHSDDRLRDHDGTARRHDGGTDRHNGR